jgi:hypothetical protein
MKVDASILVGFVLMASSRLLRPWFLAVIGWHEIDPEVFLVPLSRRCWIFCAEEQASNSSYMLHAKLWLTTFRLQNVVKKGGSLQSISGIVAVSTLQKLQTIRRRSTSRIRTDVASAGARRIPFVSCRSSWR